MRSTLLLFLFCFFFSISLRAQNTWSVKGVIVDTAAKAKLVNTAVIVLNAKDSILRAFTRAGADGSFELNNLSGGEYILLLTRPTYADYVEHFTLDSAHHSHDFGALNMQLKAKLLADVIIKGKRVGIKIKGDTTEFDAKAYVIQPNDKVEDLLRQLPGIEIDQNGKITAQGQQVNNVLVDGEEFFGDDPTLVTKNIRADMVDKVQLYDKKSDQASFTGIDDGKKTKTINIQLKADKKDGYFGKAAAGDGTDGYYEGQLLFNMFKAKEKFAVYAIVGDDGKTGLGWQDDQKYGTSDNITFGDDGGMYISFSGNNDGLDSFNGQYNGQGTPLARTGGLHYDGKWDNDNQSINANYKIGSLEVDGTGNTLTENNLPAGIINSNSNQTSDNFMFRQKLDLTYQIKLDTTSNLKINVAGTLKNTHAKSDYTASSEDGNGILLNNDDRDIDNKDNTQLLDASAFYTKKFRKKGRTLSFLVGLSENQTNSDGYLNSTANFYAPTGQIDSSQTINQYKKSSVESLAVKTNLTYTEPLSKEFSAIFNYGFGVDNGTSNLQSFNPSAPGVYNIMVDSLSDDYKLNELSNQVGAILNYKKKKITLNFGTKVSSVNFNQTDEVTGSVLKRNFVNWAPQANISYNIAQQQYINLYYFGNTVQPTLAQIQPIVVNTDPLNITIGNPNLTPSFTNRISANYYSSKVISGQWIYISGNYSFTSNPIVSNLVTDSTGKTTSQYVNLGSKKQSNYDLNIEFDQNVEKIDIRPGFNLSVNGNNSYNLSNNEINLTNSITYSLQAHLAKEAENKYNTYVNFGPDYTFSGSSLQPGINNNGLGFDANWGFTFYLPAKFQVVTDGSYEWRGKTETFNTDFNRTLVNASIAKTFLKQDNLKFAIAANDLLNQNTGFTRSSSANFITQNTYSTIRRYFMASITYDFSKMGGITATK